jgi:uncharacterized protein YlxW (UPF0749 family)
MTELNASQWADELLDANYSRGTLRRRITLALMDAVRQATAQIEAERDQARDTRDLAQKAASAAALENQRLRALPVRFETEANQLHCETILLRNECIRLRELNAALSGYIESLDAVGNGIETTLSPEVIEAIDAVSPPEVAVMVGATESTRVQSPVEVLDQAIQAVWGQSTCACAVPVLEDLRARMGQV